MDAEYAKLQKENFWLRLTPTHRVIIGLTAGALVFILLNAFQLNVLLRLTFSWDIFAAMLIVLSWTVIFARSTARIREFARREDGSRLYVFLLVLISSFASMIAVLMLILSKSDSDKHHTLYLIATIAGMLFSWIIVHTTFTFHYAHMYYDHDDNDPHLKVGGLDFPSEKKPDYLDFAYFAFVIGMTFQVSDVEISNRKIRRLALAHGLISFVLNTFVVALTVNLIAGLKG
ncbi:DUF1345 domain-containing protein [Pinibacter soli]|uniref:DUF1345 domain-containing protein n=1 Tax=Pinibacter soli TaxID=3044211 RepID=A0ABT6RCQ3_9BACT|nr:DUF1345 domain-containing protein [Pinibacter soli]MDI3320359.1 DUF1345 domain-containing protein [Pinibacter soli]